MTQLASSHASLLRQFQRLSPKCHSRGLPSQDLGLASCTALCQSLGYELCEAFFLLPYLGVLKSFRYRDARARALAALSGNPL
jgi:hypothetical protein